MYNTCCYSYIIVDFGTDWRVPPVQISSSASTGTTGEKGYSLMCSTFLVEPDLLSPDIRTQFTFEWFFGPNSNGPLPSNVTPSMTTSSMSSNPDGITYTSTLHFPQLSQHLHTGTYTCRIGVGRLANSTAVTINGEQGIMYDVATVSLIRLQTILHADVDKITY